MPIARATPAPCPRHAHATFLFPLPTFHRTRMPPAARGAPRGEGGSTPMSDQAKLQREVRALRQRPRCSVRVRRTQVSPTVGLCASDPR
eukprot:gene7784-biopygen4585